MAYYKEPMTPEDEMREFESLIESGAFIEAACEMEKAFPMHSCVTTTTKVAGNISLHVALYDQRGGKYDVDIKFNPLFLKPNAPVSESLVQELMNRVAHSFYIIPKKEVRETHE